MKKKMKKGFTLVELLVVIAILAILSTVAIVGYNSFTEKARISNDKGLVTQLNTLLQADEALDGKAKTPTDALEVVAENGFDVKKMTPTADDYSIVWNEETNRFVLLDENNVAVVEELSASAHKNWQFSSAYTQIVDGFSVCLNDNFEGTSLTVTSGLDVGNNKGIELVTYTGTSDVVIRTNGGSLTVNSGAVTHYGIGYILTVADSAKTNYVEKGTFSFNGEDINNVGSNAVGYTYVSSEAELRTALEAKQSKIALSADILIEADPSVESDFKVLAETEINLNGFDINSKHLSGTGVSKNNGVFYVETTGALTITGEGKISFETNNQMGWNNCTYVIGTRGNVTIDGAVKIENLGGTDMSYAIDAYSWGLSEELTVTIKSGYVYSADYNAIRLYRSGSDSSDNTKTFNLVVESGVVEGGRAIMVHDGNANSDGNYNVTLTGGTLISNKGKLVKMFRGDEKVNLVNNGATVIEK